MVIDNQMEDAGGDKRIVNLFRPFGYFLVDLKTTTQDNCRLWTNVLPGEERFNNVGVPDNISQELL